MAKLLRNLLVAGAGILVVFTASLLAQAVPSTMNYQGRLTDPSGNPVADGPYSVLFTIYDASTLGNSKWSETRTILVKDGLFSIVLGLLTPIPDSVFNDANRFLAVKVGADAEMTPRTKLNTVPYAMKVASIDSADGGTIIDAKNDYYTVEICEGYSALTATSFYTTNASLAGYDIGVTGGNSYHGNYGALGSGEYGAFGHHNTGSEGTLGSAYAGVTGYSGSAAYAGRFLTSNGTAGYFGCSISNTTAKLCPPDTATVLAHGGDVRAGYFENALSGLSKSTIYVENSAIAGVSCFFENNSTDANTVMTNNNSAGSILKCFGPAGALPFIVRADGHVGINTSTPAYALSVSGYICYTSGIGACSDRRFKKDITNLSGSLDRVMKMRGVTYRWKQDEFPDRKFDDRMHLGFIAQEVEELFPEVVMTDDKGYKSVDYSRLTPVLVEAIKEQQEQIKSQQDQIDELKELVSRLTTGKTHAQLGSM